MARISERKGRSFVSGAEFSGTLTPGAGALDEQHRLRRPPTELPRGEGERWFEARTRGLGLAALGLGLTLATNLAAAAPSGQFDRDLRPDRCTRDGESFTVKVEDARSGARRLIVLGTETGHFQTRRRQPAGRSGGGLLQISVPGDGGILLTPTAPSTSGACWRSSSPRSSSWSRRWR